MQKLAMSLLFAMIATSSAANLPIIKDDYAKARAEAIQRRLPLFVDVWAQW